MTVSTLSSIYGWSKPKSSVFWRVWSAGASDHWIGCELTSAYKSTQQPCIWPGFHYASGLTLVITTRIHVEQRTTAQRHNQSRAWNNSTESSRIRYLVPWTGFRVSWFEIYVYRDLTQDVVHPSSTSCSAVVGQSKLFRQLGYTGTAHCSKWDQVLSDLALYPHF